MFTNRKQSYFVHETPKGLDRAMGVVVNRDGSMLYGLRARFVTRYVEMPGAAPGIRISLEEKTICVYHVASGKSKTFALEHDLDLTFLEFYMLSDNLAVLLSFDEENFKFCQTVIYLNHKKQSAKPVKVLEATMTLARMTEPPKINLSFLDKGRVLIYGTRVSQGGVNERMTLSIAKDPLDRRNKPDEDLSGLTEGFNKYLTSLTPDINGKSLTSLFLLNIDEEEISIMLSEVDAAHPQSEPILVTNLIGIVNRKTKRFSVEKVNNEVISTRGPLTVSSMSDIKTRNGSVWMRFSVADTEKLKTIYWRFKHLYVRIMPRIMSVMFIGSNFLRRFDNGFTFRCTIRFMMYLHGPITVPMFSPPKIFYMYYLDIQRKRFYKINHSARVFENLRDFHEYDFPVDFAVDSTGGAVVVDYPIKRQEQPQMAVSYYPNPTKPQSLAKLAAHSAYRNYPAFEKSSLLRRFTGIIDWNWKI